jgi:hypothetical protein
MVTHREQVSPQVQKVLKGLIMKRTLIVFPNRDRLKEYFISNPALNGMTVYTHSSRARDKDGNEYAGAIVNTIDEVAGVMAGRLYTDVDITNHPHLGLPVALRMRVYVIRTARKS